MLRITPGNHGSRAAHIATDHPALHAANDALLAVYGGRASRDCALGGTVPISELFQRHLHRDTVFFSFSVADEDYHAPNEFFRIHRLAEGLEASAPYWQQLDDLNT